MKTDPGEESFHLKVPTGITDSSQKQNKTQVAKKDIFKIQAHWEIN